MANDDDGQIGMDETMLEDQELEDALEERLRRRETLAPYRIASREADGKATVEVERALELGDIVRVGRFRVTREMKEGRSVAFETEAKAGISITADKE